LKQLNTILDQWNENTQITLEPLLIECVPLFVGIDPLELLEKSPSQLVKESVIEKYPSCKQN